MNKETIAFEYNKSNNLSLRTLNKFDIKYNLKNYYNMNEIRYIFNDLNNQYIKLLNKIKDKESIINYNIKKINKFIKKDYYIIDLNLSMNVINIDYLNEKEIYKISNKLFKKNKELKKLNVYLKNIILNQTNFFLEIKKELKKNNGLNNDL